MVLTPIKSTLRLYICFGNTGDRLSGRQLRDKNVIVAEESITRKRKGHKPKDPGDRLSGELVAVRGKDQMLAQAQADPWQKLPPQQI
jgi:hypothetical protein